jgi:hypothetical protein
LRHRKEMNAATFGGTLHPTNRHCLSTSSQGKGSAMANGGTSGNSLADFVSAILQLVFHLLFPFITISLCLVSYILTFWLRMPEFAFWAGVWWMVFDTARSNVWVAIGLAIFVLAALPLAWVAYREQQVQVSKIILQWIIATGVIFFMFWLRTQWPFESSGWQLFVYGMIMFAGWAALTEGMLGALAIAGHVRRARPKPVRPPTQAPHGGGPHEERRRPADEPETI